MEGCQYAVAFSSDESIAHALAHHMMVESFGLNHIVFVVIPRS
jgi:hypothetical protein